MRQLTFGLLGFGATFIVGCGPDPVVGGWISDTANEGRKDVFTLTDDAEECSDEDRGDVCGSGEFYLPHFCNALIKVNVGDEDYRLDVDFFGCDEDLALKCTLSENEDALACSEGRSFSRTSSPE